MDKDAFNRIVAILTEIMQDPNIPIETRKIYQEKMENLISEGDKNEQNN